MGIRRRFKTDLFYFRQAQTNELVNTIFKQAMKIQYITQPRKWCSEWRRDFHVNYTNQPLWQRVPNI